MMKDEWIAVTAFETSGAFVRRRARQKAALGNIDDTVKSPISALRAISQNFTYS